MCFYRLSNFPFLTANIDLIFLFLLCNVYFSFFNLLPEALVLGHREQLTIQCNHLTSSPVNTLCTHIINTTDSYAISTFRLEVIFARNVLDYLKSLHSAPQPFVGTLCVVERACPSDAAPNSYNPITLAIPTVAWIP